MDKPLPQIPLNPVSSTITADRPLCASIMKDKSLDYIKFFSCVVFFNGFELFAEEAKQYYRICFLGNNYF